MFYNVYTRYHVEFRYTLQHTWRNWKEEWERIIANVPRFFCLPALIFQLSGTSRRWFCWCWLWCCHFLFQILSRSKPATGPNLGAQNQQTSGRKQVPRVEDFLATRDYTGALTVLEVWKVIKLVYIHRHRIL